MANIVLVGFMGTGKTSIGKHLAEKLGCEFIETDDIIEQREGASIKEIFEKKGEPYFRDVEKEVVREVSQKRGVVISAGGGAIIDDENFKNLKKNSVIICLEASPEVILKRTKGNTCRPLLNVSNPRKKVEELLGKRKPYYKKADYCINTDGLTIEQVVGKITKIINKP
jgi:shikimate kinase